MFQSAESRWFFEGALPDAMRRWFEGGGPVRSEPARTDDYLLLPGCTTTGVKLREGCFEIKALTRAPVAVTYAGGVAGYRDAWVKWSCRADDEAALRRMVGATGDRWAAVSKTRLLRLFSLDAGTPAALVDGTARVMRGCQVELTAIEVVTGALGARAHGAGEAAQWWSLSLEAFDHDATDRTAAAMSHLAAVAERCFRDRPPCPVGTTNARAYPAWLAALA